MRRIFFLVLVLALLFISPAFHSYAESNKIYRGEAGYTFEGPSDWLFKPSSSGSMWDQLISADGKSNICIVFGESLEIPPGGDLGDSRIVSKSSEEVFNSEILGEISGSSKEYTIMQKTPIVIDGKGAIAALLKVRDGLPENPPYLEKIYVVSDRVYYYYALYYRSEDESSFQNNLAEADAVAQSFKCIPQDKVLRDKEDAEEQFKQL